MNKALIFLFCPFFVFAKSSHSEQITIICTTNPIPSIPSTKILYESMKSLHQIPIFRECKKLIVFDGIQSGFETYAEAYEQYKENVQRLTETSPYFTNTELIFCPSWVHLSGAIRIALQYVQTPFLFIHQHDFVLLKPFALEQLLFSMQQNPNIKYVRLNQYKKNRPRKKKGFHYTFDGEVDREVEGGALVPLSRTFGWSDNDHITRTDYYREFVLPQCGFGAMEWFLHPLFKSALQEQGTGAHALFGTYLYGDLDGGGYLYHLNGRE